MKNPKMMREPMFPANLLLLLLFFSISFAIDTLAPSHPLSNGETLVSKNGTFALGFFSPSDSNDRYLGIWCHNLAAHTIVWIANRGDPIRNINATLSLTANDASLQLITTDNSSAIWSSPSFPKSVPNPIAQLLDTGNLVIKAPNSTSYLWQSFDYPTDTLLSGMKLGPDLKTGVDRNLKSWLSNSDPSPGSYVLAIDPIGVPQLVIRNASGSRIWRGGPWNGNDFYGAFPTFFSDGHHLFVDQISNSIPEENNFYLNTFGDAIYALNIDQNGRARLLGWKESSQKWDLMMVLPSTVCDFFSTCGINAICDPAGSPACRCLDGFSPVDPVSWSRGEWLDGCARVAALGCGANGTDGFMLVSGTTLPDSSEAAEDSSLGFDGCQTRCLMNCSCKAFASGGGSGCIIWMAEIRDLRVFADHSPQDLYVRISSSHNGLSGHTGRSRKKLWVSVVASIAAALLLVIILLCTLMIRRRKHKAKEQSISLMNWDHKIIHELDGEEGSSKISILKFSHVVSATENFSDINKLGQGGFGPVYKGKLPSGQVVAIKRLSARSGQGLEEFKNEILLIAKLQHRNLVRLLGCCIYEEEKMLIYEFMPNKSLDVFLFDVEQKSKLDWATRFQIIEGIAHGLFYLHKHSRLRIIHRDLKASNILLDADMNPKISDFGLARIFESNDAEVNTRRIVGTLGYMSPEYVSEGRFSIKSDVFSFGVLLLEIVSGKRNHSFHEYDSGYNLLGYAWDLWEKGNWMQIVDHSFDNDFQNDQMARCIYVALLCVQERPEDRPSISDVIAMLGNENLYFNFIKQPAFFTMKYTSNFEKPLNQHVNTSSNGLTISTVKGR